ncbi:Integrase catalytic domain-containing protein [Aphis craccivora]|uniref:Integrase catalytic domain-containing protein n=1 Tax=Aphis craccivora TaxID=307492 RepID=A0A6G0Y805_APHCR|nr:Integrase catalytic domain-containing protein [Aphis craccivora]
MPTWIILGGDNVQPSWRRPHSFHIGNPVAIRRHRGPLLHDLSKNVVHNADTILPLFRARKRDIASLLSQFKAEQDSILDILVQLQRTSEYQITYVPIDIVISEQYYNILAVTEEVGVNAPLSVPPVTVSTQECSHVQLPKIKLPHFDGDFCNGSPFVILEVLMLSCVPYRDQSPTIPLQGRPFLTDKLFSFSTLRSSSLDDLKHFLDTFQENIAALANFDIPDKEGFLLFYLASRVLDSNTKCLFESQRDNRTIPVIDELLTFVQTRFQVLQNSAVTFNWGSTVKNKPTSYTKKGSSFMKTSLVANASESHKPCLLCRGPCPNCISSVHDTSKCSSKYSCRHCVAKHHLLLHVDTPKTKGFSNLLSSTSSTSGDSSISQDVATVNIGTVSCINLSVLGTASIWIWDNAIDIVGLSQTPISRVKGVVTCLFTANSTTSPEYSWEPIVLTKITGILPSMRLNPNIRRIDFLLGADIYNQLFTDESRVHHTPGFPSAFETRLGWISIGPIAHNGTESSPNSLTPVVQPIPFTEQQKCENWFVQTTQRDESGRYIVTFPFMSDPCILGGIPGVYRCVHTAWPYAPCHIAWKVHHPASRGSALNDIVFRGQKLQQDISILLMSCRLQWYMFTADIYKMYRQIKLSHSQKQYQHILWRNCPSDLLQEYALSTVTYRVACLPFQAIRVLHQLEADEGAKFPSTKNVFKSQTYVDDIITGGPVRRVSANTPESTLLPSGKWWFSLKEVDEQ